MPEQPRKSGSFYDRREIRVFISSTFRDMSEEREELVKQVFPQLRRLCENRGVTWGEVDLRWGVPDEAKAEGKVLPLCLQEIDRCRPYFIGLLGERFGWIPERIPESLLETQPWLIKHQNQSVTALEILHGVLLNPEMEKHAFFYFRDAAYAAARPGFTEEDPDLREKLARLKVNIRNSGFTVREPFTNPKQLGEWVLHDLTAVIERLYPEMEIPNALDRSALDHEAYSASRRSVYIGRSEYIDQLNAHAGADGQPLVITGESGGGKSALLANWSHAWSQEHPETPLLIHFIGAAPDSTDWMAMLRRLLGEFERKFGIQIEIPDKPDALRAAFANALHMVATRGRLVLALDALNQIEDRDGAPDLIWLPPVIPPNVRLVLSTLPGRPRNDLKRRGWPVMTVEPLTTPERERLIVDYLLRFAKQLDERRRKRIAAAPQTGNGLYLSTLLNELRLFGRHDDLDRRIDWYLQAANPFELYSQVIKRWEQDYEERGAGSEDLVGKSLTRIWAARRGLSEVELLESLGSDDAPLPRALWTPLYLAAGDALVNRGGLLTFAHDYLREAVRDAYLPTKAHEHDAHLGLAKYFSVQREAVRNSYLSAEAHERDAPHDLAKYFSFDPGPRQFDELAWQLHEAAEWQLLARVLADPDVLQALWTRDQFEVKAYWTRIETDSPLRMEQVYASVIQNPRSDPQNAWRIHTLLADTGKPEASLTLCDGLIDYLRAMGDRANLLVALSGKANLLRVRGDLDNAMALFKEQERLARELGNDDGLSVALGSQATILFSLGEWDAAMLLYKQQERLCRKLDDKKGLSISLGNQASVLYTRGELDSAMVLYKEQEHLCRELSNYDALSLSLINQALILYSRRDLDGAMAIYEKQERLYLKLGNKNGLEQTFGAQALVLKTRGNLDGAMALLKKMEVLCRELGDKHRLAESLGIQANILEERGDPEGSMALHKQEERLYRELRHKDGLRAALNNQASLLYDLGDLDRALVLRKEQEVLCRDLQNNVDLTYALGAQALILKARGNLDGAMALHKEEEGICRQIGYDEGLKRALGNQAVILTDQGDLDRAMELLEEDERLCRKLDDKVGLQISFGNQARVLHGRGDLAGAIPLIEQAVSVLRELGDKSTLPTLLGNLGVMFQERGDLERAMALYKEQEQLCQKLASPAGFLVSLLNQANLLAKLPGRRAEAIEIAEKGRQIAARHGYRQPVSAFEKILGSLLVENSTAVNPDLPSTDHITRGWATPSTPHPAANPATAAQLSIEYQMALNEWQALPWLKRARTPRPMPPTGI